MKAAACNATAECWRAYATHAVPCGESKGRGGAIIAPPSSEVSAPRKKRALIVWGAAHDAVFARIDASRRAQVGSQLWVGARAAAAASILRQAGAGVGRKRAAEGRADDDDARARVRQRASGGGGEDGDTIL